MGPLLFGCLDSLPVSSYRMADDDHRWQQQFREEKSSVVAVPCLPSDRVEHIGRTAVPGLGAKPLIDLMVGIPGPRDWTENGSFYSSRKALDMSIEAKPYRARPSYAGPIPEDTICT